MAYFHALQHCSYCRMQEHLLVNHLTPEQREEMNALCFRIALPQGSAIFRQGNASSGVMVLRRGRAKVTMNSEQDRTIILYMAAPGEILGLSSVISGTTHQTTPVAVEPCELDLVRSEEFLEFLERHQDNFRAALEELSAQHACILDAIRRLSLAPSLLVNLARFLLGLNCPETGPQIDRIHLRQTQEEIAQQLGATRESVARAFAKLRRNKIIEQKGQTVTLRDRAMLEHLAATATAEKGLQETYTAAVP